MYDTLVVSSKCKIYDIDNVSNVVERLVQVNYISNVYF